MATVRKLTLVGKRATTIRWQLRYVDRAGKRHTKNFKTKALAEAERVRIESEIAAGTHVPEHTSQTVGVAVKTWVQEMEQLQQAGHRERSTVRPYERHYRLHIAPREIADIRLGKLTTPDCQRFMRDLELSLSPAMASKVMKSLTMALTAAQRRGWIIVNPAKPVKASTLRREDDEVVIPEKDEVRRILATAQDRGDNGMVRAMVALAVFAGLRASEIIGLTKSAVTITGRTPKVKITQRVDQWGQVGPPKSAAGRREIPLGPAVAQALRQWLPYAPKSKDFFIFCTSSGKPIQWNNFYNRNWTKLMTDAGLADPAANSAPGDDEKPRMTPRYRFHDLRHTAASLWIEQGVKPKRLQKLMGHASLQMTMDLYGHLWADPDGDQAIARGTEELIFGKSGAGT